MDLKHRLISNTLFSIIRLGFARVFGFIITPYILFRLGQEKFGMWAIVGGFLGFVAKADMGVATSYAKFISQFYARKDYENINKVINSGFVYYVGISVIIYTTTYLWSTQFFEWYLRRYAVEIVAEIKWLFHYLILLTMFSWSLDIFSAVLWGIQRADIVQKIQMVLFVVNAFCIVLFLESGYKLEGMVWAEALTAILRVVVCMIFSYKLVPELHFNPLLFDMTMFRKMFTYGLRLQFSRIAKIGQIQLSKMFLPYFLSLSAITIYEIGNRISLSIRSIPLSLSPAIVPAASQLHALEDTEVLNRLYDRASRYMTIAVMYLSGFSFCMMPVIILSWTGEQIDVHSVSIIARILLIGYSYYLLSDIASVVVLGMGHPEYLARASVLKLIILVVLNMVLIPNFGVVAAALATSVSEMLGTFYFAWASHKELHKSYRSVIRKIYLQPIAASVTASVITLAAYKSLCYLLFVPQGRLENISVVLVCGVIFTGVYGLMLLTYIDAYDKALFFKYYRKYVKA